jgi:hypothetical protein
MGGFELGMEADFIRGSLGVCLPLKRKFRSVKSILETDYYTYNTNVTCST